MIYIDYTHPPIITQGQKLADIKNNSFTYSPRLFVQRNISAFLKEIFP